MSVKNKLRKFKLLRGTYFQRETGSDGESNIVEYEASDPKRNIVTSSLDLEERYGDQKFQSLDRIITEGDELLRQRIAELEAENAKLRRENGQAEPSAPEESSNETGLHAMTIQQLRAIARERGVDLEPGLKKDELIQLIQFASESES